MASNLGLGWSLSAGGEILRIQHGAPDDQYNPEADVVNMNDATASNLIYQSANNNLYSRYYPNGYLYKTFDLDYWPKQMAFQPRFGPLGGTEFGKYKMAPKAGEDTEQDEFMIMIAGIRKTFVIGRNFEVRYEDGSLLKTAILKEATTDQTLYNQNIITKIKGFIITDENGVEYKFDQYERDEMVELEKRTVYALNERFQKPSGKMVISRWVLTSIKDPLTNREIQFEYITENWRFVTDISLSYSAVSSVVGASKSIIFGFASTYWF